MVEGLMGCDEESEGPSARRNQGRLPGRGGLPAEPQKKAGDLEPQTKGEGLPGVGKSTSNGWTMDTRVATLGDLSQAWRGQQPFHWGQRGWLA